MSDHHAKKNINVPDNVESPDHHCQHHHGRDHQDDKKKSTDHKKKKEDVGSKGKQRDKRSSDSSSSKSRKASTAIFKKLNDKSLVESGQNKDKEDKENSRTSIASNVKCMVIQEYSDILETIKKQNSNLEKIKMQMLSTRARDERENLEMLYCAEEDNLNAALVKAIIIQSKCPRERWPEIPGTFNIIPDRNELKALTPAYVPRQSAGEEKEKKLDCKSAAQSTASSDCSTGMPSKTCSDATVRRDRPANEPDNVFKGLLDKVDSMVTCLNESKDLNNQIINLLRKGREHLKLCNQCGPSSDNCGKLESICDELRNVCNQKLKQLSKDNRLINDRQKCGGSSRSSHGGSNFNNYSSADECTSFLKSPICCCSRKTTSSTTHDNCCWCKPRTPKISKETCCCSTPGPAKPKKKETCCRDRDSDKMLSMCECVAKDLKELKNKNECCPSNISSGLMREIQCLQEKIKELVCENEEMRFLLKEQEAQTQDFRRRYMTAKQAVEEHSAKIDGLKKANDNITEQVNDRIESAKKNLEDKVGDLPQRLEEESKKLLECLAEKEELKKQLTTVGEELKKEQEKVQIQAEELGEVDQLKDDIAAAQQMNATLEKQSALQKEEITSLKNELAELRKEAASMLGKIKERAERQMADACRRIEELEEELARERANVCFAIKEKEKCYKDLECALCSAQTSQVRVKKLQTCIRALMEQLNNSNRKGCCRTCGNCKD